MKTQDYAAIAASLDRAIEICDEHPALFGLERDVCEKLHELRARIARLMADAVNR